jgi:hypothetical protein
LQPEITLVGRATLASQHTEDEDASSPWDFYSDWESSEDAGGKLINVFDVDWTHIFEDKIVNIEMDIFTLQMLTS